MGNEKKRGVKDKIWDFWGCEEWRVPIREIKTLGEVVRKLKHGGEGEETDAIP